MRHSSVMSLMLNSFLGLSVYLIQHHVLTHSHTNYTDATHMRTRTHAQRLLIS